MREMMRVVYTCIPCRFSAKGTFKCPYCAEPMLYMGKAFKPPRKTNDSQWRKVETLVAHGFRFGYCSCHKRRVMKSLADAKDKCQTRRVAKRNYAEVVGVRANQVASRKRWKAAQID